MQKENDDTCENNSKTLQHYVRRFLRGHWSFVGHGSEKKWYGTYGIPSSGIPLYQRFGKKRIEKQTEWKEVNTVQWQHRRCRVASPNRHLCQSAQYLRSSGGYDWRIANWSESSGETRCTKSTGQTRNSYTTFSCRNVNQWRATGKLAARLRATIWKNGQKIRNYFKTKLRSRFEIGRSWTILLNHFRHQEEQEINVCAENIRCLKIKEELVSKGGSKAMYDLALSRAITTEHTYSVEVQVQSWFQDQTASRIQIVNGIDKFVREAMPIQEEEKDSGKFAAKARPILKPSSTSFWWLCSYETETMDWHWNTRVKWSSLFSSIEISLDNYDIVKKFIEKMNGAIH